MQSSGPLNMAGMPSVPMPSANMMQGCMPSQHTTQPNLQGSFLSNISGMAGQMSVPGVSVAGLGGLLETLQSTGMQGLLQVNSSMLFTCIVSLLRCVGEHEHALENLRKGQAETKSVVEGVPGLTQKVEHLSAPQQVVVPQPSNPLTDPSLQQMIAGIHERLLSVEMKCEETNVRTNKIERIDQLENEVARLRQNPSETATLQASIQDMLQTCQSLAAKQADTVAVVSQSCQRLDMLEGNVAQLRDMVMKTLHSSEEQAEHVKALFDLPMDLKPHLGTPERRFKLLAGTPTFHAIFSDISDLRGRLQNNTSHLGNLQSQTAQVSQGLSQQQLQQQQQQQQIAVLQTPQKIIEYQPPPTPATSYQPSRPPPQNPSPALPAATSPGDPYYRGIDNAHISPYRQKSPSPSGANYAGNQVDHLRRLVSDPQTLSNVPELTGATRSGLENADKLVAVLAQALADRGESAKAGLRSPVRVGSPRAREFVALDRSESSCTAVGRNSADFTLLGLEAIETPPGIVIVQSIQPDSPASIGGIRMGDKLISLNGSSIGSRSDLLRSLAKTKPSQLIPVIFVPKGTSSPVATHLVVGGVTVPNTPVPGA